MRHVNPSELKASELRALVALWKHGGPAWVTDGHVFTTNLIFRFSIAVKLIRLGLLSSGIDKIELSRTGAGIAKIFENRPIQGYD